MEKVTSEIVGEFGAVQPDHYSSTLSAVVEVLHVKRIHTASVSDASFGCGESSSLTIAHSNHQSSKRPLTSVSNSTLHAPTSAVAVLVGGAKTPRCLLDDGRRGSVHAGRR